MGQVRDPIRRPWESPARSPFLPSRSPHGKLSCVPPPAHGFKMDETKTEVAWIFASEQPGPVIRKQTLGWILCRCGFSRKFNMMTKPTQWLGFFVDCQLNWRAHVRHRLVLGYHRLRTVTRVMTANGILRKLARMVARAAAMSTADYSIEALWEG